MLAILGGSLVPDPGRYVYAATALAAHARHLIDGRPRAAYAALPAPGRPAPDFVLPLMRGGNVSPATLRGRPTVLALWALDCGVSRAALRGIAALRDDYATRGVEVVLLADDDSVALQRLLDSTTVRVPIAAAAGRLAWLFDQSRGAPEGERLRVEFALPGFLVVDATGRVVSREAGVPEREFVERKVQLRGVRQVLDSLLESAPGASAPGAASIRRSAPAAHVRRTLPTGSANSLRRTQHEG